MHPRTNPLAMLVALALLALLAWFVFDAYLRGDPAAPAGEPAGTSDALEPS